MVVREAYRGWSQKSLQAAIVGVRPGDPTFHRVPELDGPALVVLTTSPEIGWGLSPSILAELANSSRVWDAVLEHDAIIEAQWRAAAKGQTGSEKYWALKLTELRNVIGLALQTSLADLAARPPWAARVRDGAETSWVSLAGRLGPALPRWLDDDHGSSKVLGVCELTGGVFRGERGRRFHPALPRQPKRAQRSLVTMTARGPVALRVGPYVQAADPFERYAFELWSRQTCAHCGADFESRRQATYCSGRCKTAAARERKRHQPRSGAFMVPNQP